MLTEYEAYTKASLHHPCIQTTSNDVMLECHHWLRMSMTEPPSLVAGNAMYIRDSGPRFNCTNLGPVRIMSDASAGDPCRQSGGVLSVLRQHRRPQWSKHWHTRNASRGSVSTR